MSRSRAPFRRTSYAGPRPDVIALLPTLQPGHTIVDVGCSSGAVGQAIKGLATDCTVIGIEVDPAFVEEATPKLDRVLRADALAGLRTLQDEGVVPDVILFADVLEHLLDPWAAVDLALDLLAAGGAMVFSVPNVAHIDTFLNLLGGRWPMRDRGIHDDTHLRFFARKDVTALATRGRGRIEQLAINYRIVERPHPVNRFAPAIGRVWPNLFAYQYLVRVAVPSLASGVASA